MLTTIMLKQPTPGSGTASTTLFNADGLVIVGSCDASGNASLAASGPSAADAELTLQGVAKPTR